MRKNPKMSVREKLVFHVQELERVEALKAEAAACVKDSFDAAKRDGFDPATLKAVLKLRKMTPEQRRERRALETIYLAAIGMLEGDPLTDEARRRLDGGPTPAPTPAPADQRDRPDLPDQASADAPAEPDDTRPMPAPPAQPPLILKTPDEARAEGSAAAAAGKRVYDNPYPAGDPCRAAWDEGWCAQQKSHGMETPAAYQRRSPKAPESDPKTDDESKKGAS